MARRKATKKRSTAKKGATCPKKGARKKISGEFFTVKCYFKSKSAGKKAAESHRGKGKGKKARLVKTTCGWQLCTKG